MYARWNKVELTRAAVELKRMSNPPSASSPNAKIRFIDGEVRSTWKPSGFLVVVRNELAILKIRRKLAMRGCFTRMIWDLA